MTDTIKFECFDDFAYEALLSEIEEQGVRLVSKDGSKEVVVELDGPLSGLTLLDLTVDFAGTMSRLVDGAWEEME